MRNMHPILPRVRQILSDLEQQGKQPSLNSRRVLTLMNDDQAVPTAEELAALTLDAGINGHWLLTGLGDKTLIGQQWLNAVYTEGVQEGLRRREAK